MPSLQDCAVERAGRAPLFSVIMPCYNVERYVGAAIDAMQAQTVSDWELICVDDGSLDGTARVISECAAADARIRLVSHERNRGLSAARNTGLSQARGTYVWMPDPDDTYDADVLSCALAAFERVAEQAVESVAVQAADPVVDPPAEREPGPVSASASSAAPQAAVDVVVFGCRERYFDASGAQTGERAVVPPAEGVLSGDALHAFALDLEEATLYGYAWNKVYRRSAITGLSFESTPLIEDILFNLAVFDRARAVAVIARPLYGYAKRLSANLTNKFVPEYYAVHRRRIAELYAQQQRWGTCNDACRARLGSLYARYIMSALERNCDPRAKMSHRARVAWCRELFSDPLYADLLPVAHARSGKVLAVCLPLIRSRSAAVLTALGRVIHIVRTGFGAGYARLKTQR